MKTIMVFLVNKYRNVIEGKLKFFLITLNKSYTKSLQFILRFIFLFVFLIGVFLFLLLYNHVFTLPEDKEFETSLAIIGLFALASYNIVNYKIAYDRLFQELFVAFNRRYDDMNEDLEQIKNGEFNGCNKSIIDGKEEGKIKTKKSIVIDYLNLCAEEYLWYQKGRIDAKVWKSWEKATKFNLEHLEISCVVSLEKEEKDSYYGLFESGIFKLKECKNVNDANKCICSEK